MIKNADIDTRIKFLLEKLLEEFEIVKRQGFPSRKRDYNHQYARIRDAIIPEQRWRSWAYELGIDYTQIEAILKILTNEGLLEKAEFTPDYV